MSKPFERFFIALFDLALVIIVVINFFGWTGSHDIFQHIDGGYWGAVDVVVDGIVEHRVYYFGFSSLQRAIAYLNAYIDNFGNGVFSLGNVIGYFQQLLNFSLGNIPQLVIDINSWVNGGVNFDILTLLRDLVLMFATAFGVIFYGFMILLSFLFYGISLLTAFVGCVGGLFNDYTVAPITASDYLSSMSAVSSAMFAFI